MAAIIINGKEIAAKIENQTAKRVALLKRKGVVPKLAVVLVGDNTPSRIYIRRKKAAAERTGINFVLYEFDVKIKEDNLVKKIKKIQADKKLSGLIIQLPLPEKLYTSGVLNSINPEIDVDCLTDANIGKLVMKTNKIEPPTPWCVVHVLKEICKNLAGKDITIIGMGALVGKPLAIMLANEQASITTCNSHTRNIKEKCRKADIVVTGVGKKNILTKDMIKRGAVVIDTGIVFVDGKVRGDTDFKEVAKKASYITPTPGGIGPITVSKLLLNTVICAEEKHKQKIRS
jgi:methylenetetrahydrofolate dehydrogenase (NADP+)/methenyltetrahydrofolate cyclohydrolase